MRKIIQISTTNVENTASTQCNYISVALCDDGTVWKLADAGNDWYKFPSIPQDDKNVTQPLIQDNEDLQEKLKISMAISDAHQQNYHEMLKRVDEIVKERNALKAELQSIKTNKTDVLNEDGDKFFDKLEKCQYEKDMIILDYKHLYKVNEKLQKEIIVWKDISSGHEQNYLQILKRIDEIAKERNDLKAELSESNRVLKNITQTSNNTEKELNIANQSLRNNIEYLTELENKMYYLKQSEKRNSEFNVIHGKQYYQLQKENEALKSELDKIKKAHHLF